MSSFKIINIRTVVYGTVLLGHSILASEPTTSVLMPNADVGITSFVKMFFGLIIVVSIIFGAGWVSKRLNLVQKFTSGYQIKNLATLSLTSREKITLIEVGGQQILIGIAPGQVSRLHSFDEPIEVEDPGNLSEGTSSFADHFKKMLSPTESKSEPTS